MYDNIKIEQIALKLRHYLKRKLLKLHDFNSTARDIFTYIDNKILKEFDESNMVINEIQKEIDTEKNN